MGLECCRYSVSSPKVCPCTSAARPDTPCDRSYISAIRAALPSLMGCPYGCVEQTMSRYLPALTASKAFHAATLTDAKLEAELPRIVAAGQNRLLGFQHDDGGWGWWKHDDSDEFMTPYVLFGLLIAREADFDVPPKASVHGVENLRKSTKVPVALHVRRLAGDDVTEELRPTLPRTYRVRPAVLFPMYTPDDRTYSELFVLTVADQFRRWIAERSTTIGRSSWAR